MRRPLLLALLLASPALAQDEGSPDPSPERAWVEEIRAAVPAEEIRLAAEREDEEGAEDPLLALAARHGVDAPDWLRERVRTQGRRAYVAGMGNSLTAAMASCSFPYYFCPGNSWAVGDFPGSVKRRLAAESGREVGGLLVAVPGVGAGALPLEAFVVYLASAFGLDVRRVTVEIGHNDPGVCGRDEEGAVAAFERDARSALRILGRVAKRRNARVFLSSMVEVPSISRYAGVTPAGSERACRELWDDKRTCREVLDHVGEPERMARVSARIAEYDAVLARLAAEKDWLIYTAALNEQSRRGLPDPARALSRFDCFHPSAEGQALISKAAWEGDGETPGIADFFRLEPPAAPRPPALAELSAAAGADRP